MFDLFLGAKWSWRIAQPTRMAGCPDDRISLALQALVSRAYLHKSSQAPKLILEANIPGSEHTNARYHSLDQTQQVAQLFLRGTREALGSPNDLLRAAPQLQRAPFGASWRGHWTENREGGRVPDAIGCHNYPPFDSGMGAGSMNLIAVVFFVFVRLNWAALQVAVPLYQVGPGLFVGCLIIGEAFLDGLKRKQRGNQEETKRKPNGNQTEPTFLEGFSKSA